MKEINTYILEKGKAVQVASAGDNIVIHNITCLGNLFIFIQADKPADNDFGSDNADFIAYAKESLSAEDNVWLMANNDNHKVKVSK
jgi:hypothetical protein